MSDKDIVLSDSESSQSSAFNVVMSASQSSELLKTKSLGRNQENTIHTYFEYNSETDKSKCKVSNCNKEIKGKRSTNLITHLRTNHKNEYQTYTEIERKNKKNEN
jgi:hypothetical protein